MAQAAPPQPTRFSTQTIEQLSKLQFRNEKTKFSSESLALTTEMTRVYTLEILHRANKQARSEGCETIAAEHIEKILPQLLLDFL